jgi:hypothetical protein
MIIFVLPGNESQQTTSSGLASARHLQVVGGAAGCEPDTPISALN